MRERELVLVTRHGKVTSLLLPLRTRAAMPMELRRELLEQVAGAIRTHLKPKGATERRVLRDFEAFKKRRRRR
jgi:hypothetical protein